MMYYNIKTQMQYGQALIYLITYTNISDLWCQIIFW